MITVLPPPVPPVIPYDATLPSSVALIVPIWFVKVSFALVSVNVMIVGVVTIGAVLLPLTVMLLPIRSSILPPVMTVFQSSETERL